MDMSIASTAFEHNGTIPRLYTCEGQDISPPLNWAGVPPGTKTLALIVDDPDAPDPAAPKMAWVHWVLYNLPATLTGLRTRAGANGSHALGTVVRARVLAEALTMGRRTDVARSPLVFHGALALEFAIGRRIAVELSGHVYESDQHRTQLVDAGDGTVRRERVRSVDVFPSLDVIVRGP